MIKTTQDKLFNRIVSVIGWYRYLYVLEAAIVLTVIVLIHNGILGFVIALGLWIVFGILEDRYVLPWMVRRNFQDVMEDDS